jgi:hypothetical protein
MPIRTVATTEPGLSAKQVCLYLGPRGERCVRPAGESGFCDRHDPELARPAAGLLVKRLWAAVLALVFLWPLLMDFLRILRRWIP